MRKILYFIAILFPQLLEAQSYNFVPYSVENGLAQSQVTGICEDIFGNLWFATQSKGISKFDGKQFISFNTAHGLKDNSVHEIISDSKGRIWIGSRAGLTKIENGKLKHYDSGLDGREVYKILEDKYGNIWFAYDTGGIHRINGNKITIYREKGGFSNRRVSSIVQDKKGLVWVSTYSSEIFQFISGKFRKVTDIKLEAKTQVISMYFDSNNVLWLGTNKGLYRYQNGNLESIPELTNHSIYFITEDDNGTIWMSSLSGAIKYNGKHPVFFKEKEGLTDAIIKTIFKDREGTLWFASDGEGVFKFQGETFQYINKKYGLSQHIVMSITKDIRGNYWFATLSGGVNRFSGDTIVSYSVKDGLSGNAIACTVADRSGNVFFGTKGGGLNIFDGKNFRVYSDKNGFPSNYITDLILDGFGNVWIATSNGVVKFKGNQYEHFIISDQWDSNVCQKVFEIERGKILVKSRKGFFIIENNKVSKINMSPILEDKELHSIVQDSRKNLWMGVLNHGVYRYNRLDGKVDSLTEAEGLTSNLVFSLLLDNDGNLWVGTEKGVDKVIFSPEGKIMQINKYGKSEGFSGIETNANAVFKDDDGKLWFGTIKGVYIYNKLGDIKNQTEPITYISDLLLHHEQVDWESYVENTTPWYNLPIGLRLPLKKNHLTFKYSGTSLKNPEKVLYSYKLENFDDQWSPPSNINQAIYSNLPPGDYKFLVKACNNDGIWNKKPAALAFTINRPFWMAWWFYCIVALLILTGIKLFYNYRINKRLNRVIEKEKIKTAEAEKVRKQVARDFHDEVGNHLASILVLTQVMQNRLNGTTSEINEVLRKIDYSAKALFNGTRSFIWSIDPKNDKLFEVVIYLKDFAEDLFNNTEINFHSEANELVNSDVILPPGWSRHITLIFKEALTNCLKHSLCKNVYLSFSYQENTFSITLKDDGAGINFDDSKKGKGLENMLARSKKIDSSIQITKINCSGTEVVLGVKIPH